MSLKPRTVEELKIFADALDRLNSRSRNYYFVQFNTEFNVHELLCYFYEESKISNKLTHIGKLKVKEHTDLNELYKWIVQANEFLNYEELRPLTV